MLKVFIDPETGDILKSYEIKYIEMDVDFSISDEIVFNKETNTIVLKNTKEEVGSEILLKQDIKGEFNS